MLLELLNKGGFVMYPLLVCSVIALAIVLERIVFWITLSRRRDQELVNAMLSLAEQGAFDQAMTRAQDARDYMAKILTCGMAHREFSLADALQMAAAEAVKRMKKYLTVLDTIITLAPLLGIFGTVTGIIISFEFFGQGGIADPKAVTAGIAQALITTAAGLGVAMFALIPYNYFIARIADEELRIEKYATDLEIVWNKLKRSGP